MSTTARLTSPQTVALKALAAKPRVCPTGRARKGYASLVKLGLAAECNGSDIVFEITQAGRDHLDPKPEPALVEKAHVVCVGPNVRFSHGATFEVHDVDCQDLRKYRTDDQFTDDAATLTELCDTVYPPEDFQCESGAFTGEFHVAPCVRFPGEALAPAAKTAKRTTGGLPGLTNSQRRVLRRMQYAPQFASNGTERKPLEYFARIGYAELVDGVYRITDVGRERAATITDKHA